MKRGTKREKGREILIVLSLMFLINLMFLIFFVDYNSNKNIRVEDKDFSKIKNLRLLDEETSLVLNESVSKEEIKTNVNYSYLFEGSGGGGGSNRDDEDENETEDNETEELSKISIKTCQGQGDLYVYKDDQFQDIDVSFITEKDELYIFTRADYISDLTVKINNVSVNLSLVVDKTNPFKVKVYKITTSPGDVVSVSGNSSKKARAIQGYLAQNNENRAYNIEDINIVYDSQKSNTVYLYSGEYFYILFDKYSFHNNGGEDNRELNVQIKNSGIINKNYTKPYPNVEGVVAEKYEIIEEGEYEFIVDTEDSVYWFLLECEKEKECEKNDDCPEDSYGNNYCLDNVYHNFIDYSCIDYMCIFNETPELVENCEKDDCDEWQHYCRGTEVWKNRTCYERGCESGSCYEESREEDDLVDYCEFACVNGECVNECEVDEDCYDGLFCNGIEFCFEGTCVKGEEVNCSVFNIFSINTCNNNPDENPLTWDYFGGFESYCDEEENSCTIGLLNLSHTCNFSCGAECIAEQDCPEKCTQSSHKLYTLTECNSCECDYSGYQCVVGKCGAECDADSDCTCQEDYCDGTTLVDYPNHSTCGTSGSEGCLCRECIPELIENSAECKTSGC